MIITIIALLLASFLILAWFFIAFVLYFMPIIVAYIRNHKNMLPIALLNIFLGWTFFGWLAAMLWSINSDITKEDDESNENEN